MCRLAPTPPRAAPDPPGAMLAGPAGAQHPLGPPCSLEGSRWPAAALFLLLGKPSPQLCWEEMAAGRNRKQLSAPRVRVPTWSHPCRQRSPSSKKLWGTAGSWEGRNPGEMLGGGWLQHGTALGQREARRTRPPRLTWGLKPGYWGKAEPPHLGISDSSPRPECCLFGACLHPSGWGAEPLRPLTLFSRGDAGLALLCQGLAGAGVIPIS